MSFTGNKIITSPLSGSTLRISRRDEDLIAVSIIGVEGLIKASIAVRIEDLFPDPVTYEDFEFPTDPGIVFSAYCCSDMQRFDFETYTNGDGDAVYKMLEGEFYTSDELDDYTDFVLESV